MDLPPRERIGKYSKKGRTGDEPAGGFAGQARNVMPWPNGSQLTFLLGCRIRNRPWRNAPDAVRWRIAPTIYEVLKARQAEKGDEIRLKKRSDGEEDNCHREEEKHGFIRFSSSQ
jgi:hypothetical protein